MNILIASLVVCLIAMQALGKDMTFSDNGYYPYRDQIQTDLEDPTFERLLLRIARKPRPGEFYGSMGKRNQELKRTAPKLHKLETFIGLMGKRGLSSESEERNFDYDRRRK